MDKELIDVLWYIKVCILICIKQLLGSIMERLGHACNVLFFTLAVCFYPACARDCSWCPYVCAYIIIK